jgi:hypothetical protein
MNSLIKCTMLVSVDQKVETTWEVKIDVSNNLSASLANIEKVKKVNKREGN